MFLGNAELIAIIAGVIGVALIVPTGCLQRRLHLEMVSGHLETVPGRLDTVSGHLETVSGHLQTVSGHLQTVSRHLQTVLV